MDKYARWEWGVLMVLVAVLLSGVLYGAAQAAAERRDGARREAVRAVKQELEMYFNNHEQYPLEYEPVGEVEYIVTESSGDSAVGWYVRAKLERQSGSAAGFDFEHNVYWRVTDDGYFDVCGGSDTCEFVEVIN